MDTDWIEHIFPLAFLKMNLYKFFHLSFVSLTVWQWDSSEWNWKSRGLNSFLSRFFKAHEWLWRLSISSPKCFSNLSCYFYFYYLLAQPVNSCLSLCSDLWALWLNVSQTYPPEHCPACFLKCKSDYSPLLLGATHTNSAQLLTL